MTFVKGILLLHLSYFCQDQLISTTQVSTKSSGPTDENFTLLYNPYIEALSGKCHWTLKMPENSTLEEVPLDTAVDVRLVSQICQELDCGGVYNVKKIKHPSNSTCLSGCFYEEGQLQNCSLKEAKDCVIISEAVCGAHMVRLSGGRHRCEGRVELWRGGQWGSVCDDLWDLREAEVVCRQTGCGFALRVSGQGGQFPPGRGPVLLDDLNCTGAEANLWDCPATEETDCGHKEDAGVVCSEMRAVRLSGGADRCSGKVEVHRNGTWGTVCDTCWNRELASMICSMLQCGPEPQTYTQFNPPLSHNPGPLYYYHCPSGPSSTLWDCREFINSTNACKDTKASGVVCNGSLGFPVTTTTQSTTLTTGTVPDVTTLSPVERPPLHSLLLLSVASVALLLLVFLIVNTVLCCHYKNRLAVLVQQSQNNQWSKSKPRRNSYEDSVDLTKVTSYPAHDNVRFVSRPVWMQLSVDSSSVDTDYEPFEPSFSTFRNSQRHRVDRNPLMRPLGLESLHEEVPEPIHGEVGAFSSCNGADYSRTSQIILNSFDSSSTSSEETYRNTNLHSAGQNSEAVEDEGPVYSPVSPETDTSSEDDYDDVDA